MSIYIWWITTDHMWITSSQQWQNHGCPKSAIICSFPPRMFNEWISYWVTAPPPVSRSGARRYCCPQKDIFQSKWGHKLFVIGWKDPYSFKKGQILWQFLYVLTLWTFSHNKYLVLPSKTIYFLGHSKVPSYQTGSCSLSLHKALWSSN